MKRLKLSQLQEVLTFCRVEQGQVYKALGETRVPLDLLTTSVSEQANIILYTVYTLVPFFDAVCIDIDGEAKEDNLLTVEMLQEAAPILWDYGIVLSDTDVAPMLYRWLLVNEAELLHLAKCSSLGQFAMDKGYVVSPTDFFTHMYIDYTFTTEQLEVVQARLSSVRRLSDAQNIQIVNPSLRLAHERNRQSLGFSSNSSIDYLELNGSTHVDDAYPIMDLCSLEDGAQVSFQEYTALYDYICNAPQDIIVLSANGIKNNVGLAAFTALGKLHIPDMLLYLLALVHLNTGKSIEFMSYAASYEDRFLDIISVLLHRNDGYIHERLAAFDKLRIEQLYFMRVKNCLHVCVLKQKSKGLTYTVAKANEVFASMSLVEHKSSVIFDTVGLAQDTGSDWYAEGKMHQVPKREYMLCTGSLGNALSWLTQKQIPIEQIAVKDIIQVLVKHIALEQNITEEQVTRVMLDSMIYRVLRLVEQEVFEYKCILNITDLICFTHNGELYLGVASFKPMYTVQAYQGCTSKGYPFTHTTDRLIPSSVLNKESRENPFYKKLTERYRETIPEPFSRHETDLLLRACRSDVRAAVEVVNFPGLSAYNSAYVETHLLSAQLCRSQAWSVLTKYFKSSGMRDLPITRSALSVYGSIKNTQVYPVALVGGGEDL